MSRWPDILLRLCGDEAALLARADAASPAPGASPRPPRCATCVHFDNRPAVLEQALPGVTALGSGHSAVRAQDGLCRLHDRYLASDHGCARHARAH